MAIQFSCACGKAMQAKEEYAGRRVRCGGCGAIVTIPQAGVLTPVAPAPPIPAAPPAAPPPTPPRDSFQAEKPPAPAHGSYQAGPPPAFDPAFGQMSAPWDPRARNEREPYRPEGMAGWMKAVIMLIILGILGGAVWLLLSRGSGAGASSDQLALVPRDAGAFGTAWVAEIWAGKPFEKVRRTFGERLDAAMKENLGLTLADIDRVTLVFGRLDFFDFRPDAVPDIWVVIHTRTPVDQDKLLKLIPERREGKAGGKSYHTSTRGGDDMAALHFASDKEIWLGTTRSIIGLMDGSRKIAPDGALSGSIALAAAGKPLVVGFQIPAKLRADARRGAPADVLPLFEVTGGTITLDGADAEGRLMFPDAATAARAEKFIHLAVDDFRREFAGRGPMRGIEGAFVDPILRLLPGLKIEARGPEIVFSAPGAGEALAGVIPPLVKGIEGLKYAATRAAASNNMQQLTIAMHTHHDVYKSLPPARYRGGLSWRVAILPYIDQQALYNEFHLDEPWDSPHNIKLLERMPKIFAPVAGPPTKPGETCYQVFTGPGLIFDRLMDRRTRLVSIVDGTSNTFMIVESSKPVPWTKPEDIEYTPRFDKGKGGPRPELGYQVPGKFLAGMADGVARWLPRDLDGFTLDCLIHPADANVIPDLPDDDLPF